MDKRIILFGIILLVALYFGYSQLFAIYIPQTATYSGNLLSMGYGQPISIEIGTNYNDNVLLSQNAQVIKMCQNAGYPNSPTVYLTADIKIFAYKSDANSNKLSQIYSQKVGTYKFYCMNIDDVADPAKKSSFGYTKIGTFTYTFAEPNQYYYLAPVVEFTANPVELQGQLIKTKVAEIVCSSTSQAKCITGNTIAYCDGKDYTNIQVCPTSCTGSVGSAVCGIECSAGQIRCELGGSAYKECGSTGFYGSLQYITGSGYSSCQNNQLVEVCEEGGTKLATCSDGSKIITATCKVSSYANYWEQTGNTCPEVQPSPEPEPTPSVETCTEGQIYDANLEICREKCDEGFFYSEETFKCEQSPSPDKCTLNPDADGCKEEDICEAYPNMAGCQEQFKLGTTETILIVMGVVVLGGLAIMTRKRR